MSEIKVNSIKGVGASAAAITVNNTDGTCTANITNNLSNRNLIINGAMQVAQYGTSSNEDGYNTCDRFRYDKGGTDENPTQAQGILGAGDTGPYEEGFRNSFRITNGDQTSVGAGDYIQLVHRIEAQNIANSGWNYTSSSSKITFSFWVKSSVAQTMYVRLNAEDASRAYSFAFSATTSWSKITKTISGDSNLAFNNDTGIGLAVYFIPFYGTNYTTSDHTNDAWIADSGSDQVTDMTSTWYDTNDAMLEITGVQLEVGDHATDFEHRSYGQELALCQRYFAKYVNLSVGYGSGDGYARSTHLFPCQMRAEPTRSVTSTNAGSFNSSSAKVDSVMVTWQGLNGSTTGEFTLELNSEL